MNRYQWIGIGLTLLGAILWGLSGTSVQFLGNYRHMNLEWLVTVRLITAGALTVLYGWIRRGNAVFDVLRNTRDFFWLTVFGLFGMAMCQYTYFRSIVISGAGIATVLQYLAPSMIIVYLLLRYGKRPTRGEVISICLALVGTILLMMHDGVSIESFRLDVLCWGLLSAVGVAIYSVSPIRLLTTYGTVPVVGFGMLISGIILAVLFHESQSSATWDIWTSIGFFNVILLGTIVSFNAYLEGVKRVGAVTGSILSSIEPIVAAWFSWILLGNDFTVVGLIGMACIIITVFIIAYEKQRTLKVEVAHHISRKEI